MACVQGCYSAGCLARRERGPIARRQRAPVSQWRGGRRASLGALQALPAACEGQDTHCKQFRAGWRAQWRHKGGQTRAYPAHVFGTRPERSYTYCLPQTPSASTTASNQHEQVPGECQPSAPRPQLAPPRAAPRNMKPTTLLVREAGRPQQRKEEEAHRTGCCPRRARAAGRRAARGLNPFHLVPGPFGCSLWPPHKSQHRPAPSSPATWGRQRLVLAIVRATPLHKAVLSASCGGSSAS